MRGLGALLRPRLGGTSYRQPEQRPARSKPLSNPPVSITTAACTGTRAPSAGTNQRAPYPLFVFGLGKPSLSRAIAAVTEAATFGMNAGAPAVGALDGIKDHLRLRLSCSQARDRSQRRIDRRRHSASIVDRFCQPDDMGIDIL